MSDYSNGEVFGAKILNAVIIIGAAALLLAAITSPAPKARIAQGHAPLQVAEQVIVTTDQG